MRVLLLCLDMDPFSEQGDKHTGAAHLYVQETIQMYNDKNVELLAVTRWNSIEKLERFSYKENSKLVRLKIGEISYEGKEYLWGREDTSLAKVVELLEKEDFSPDIVHAVYWYSGKIALALLEKYHFRFVYTPISLGKVKHSLTKAISPHDQDREETEQRIFDSSDLILSVCLQERDHLLMLYRSDRQKIVVIGRGIDPQLFHPLQSEKNSILFVGRLVESKGFQFLAKIYEEFSGRIDHKLLPKLIFVGGTESEIKWAIDSAITTSFLKNAMFDGRIVWMGKLPRSSMPSVYSRAVVTCLPSRYEPAARVILESMACGTPVIMTPTGYSNELVFNGINGYVADFEDIDTWCRYLYSVVNDPTWRDILGARAREAVFPHFSLAEFGERQWSAVEVMMQPRLPLVSTENKAIRKAQKLHQRWSIPGSKYQDNQEEYFSVVKDFCRAKYSEPEFQFSTDSESSTYQYLMEAKEGSFVIKQYLHRRPFYNRFYPHFGETPRHLDKTSRIKAEVIANEDPIFARIEEKSFLDCFTVTRKYDKVNKKYIDVEEISLFLKMAMDFSDRNRIKYLELIRSYKEGERPVKSFSEFIEYDHHLQSLNAFFRNGILWHSPAEFSIERLRLQIAVNERRLLVDENELRLIQRGLGYLSAVPKGEVSIIWGECRDQHFLFSPEEQQYYAIDGETICLGEPERDLACYVWWFLDLRSKELEQDNLVKISSFLQSSGYSASQKELTVAWIWLYCLEFYLWDAYSGRLDRIDRFIRFLDGFEATSLQLLR